MAIIRPSDLPVAPSVSDGASIPIDTGSAVQRATPSQLIDAAIPLSSQADAEAGTDNVKRVTPLRVAQAIDALGVSGTALAAGDGGDLVGFKQAGTSSVARTVDAKLKDAVSVKDFGAVGDGVANDAAAFQAALNSFAGSAGVVRVPRGIYNMGATGVTIPGKVRLHIENALINSSAQHAFILAVGSLSTSGELTGTGQNSIINHTGTGYAVRMVGAGNPSANPYVAGIHIKGSSSGLGGIYCTKFNRLTVECVKVNGYTSGAAILNEGTNAVVIIAPVFEACQNGIVNRAMFDAVVFSANAVNVFGGSIVGMSGWGYLDTTAGGSAEENIGNLLSGVTFENNGQNGSATSGHVFIQRAVGTSISGCYFEDYTGNIPASAVLIGDATYQPQTTSIADCVFAVAGTNVVSNFSGQNTRIIGNHCLGNVTNFVNNGAESRGLIVGEGNRGAGVTNLFAGADGGLDTIVRGAGSNLLNSQSVTIRGYGFNTLTGLDNDLRIRARAGATNIVEFLKTDGTPIANVRESDGVAAFGGVIVNGNQVLGPRGAAVANATDAATAITQLNALLARLRTHGLIA